MDVPIGQWAGCANIWPIGLCRIGMIYDRLTPRLQKFVDLLMEGRKSPSIGEAMNLKLSTVKRYMHLVSIHYGIPAKGPYVPSVRLVYLRAKELGLIP